MERDDFRTSSGFGFAALLVVFVVGIVGGSILTGVALQIEAPVDHATYDAAAIREALISQTAYDPLDVSGVDLMLILTFEDSPTSVSYMMRLN